jgi:hypothetical protein
MCGGKVGRQERWDDGSPAAASSMNGGLIALLLARAVDFQASPRLGMLRSRFSELSLAGEDDSQIGVCVDAAGVEP